MEEVKLGPEDVFLHDVPGRLSTERLMVELVMLTLGLDNVNDFKLRDKLIFASDEPLDTERLARKKQRIALEDENKRLRHAIADWKHATGFQTPEDFTACNTKLVPSGPPKSPPLRCRRCGHDVKEHNRSEVSTHECLVSDCGCGAFQSGMAH